MKSVASESTRRRDGDRWRIEIVNKPRLHTLNPYSFRLSAGMRNALKEAARADRRSVSSFVDNSLWHVLQSYGMQECKACQGAGCDACDGKGFTK